MVLKFLIPLIFFSGCISITTTINAPPQPPTTNTTYIEKKESIKNSSISSAPKKQKMDFLSFQDFFKYIGLLEHDNKPNLMVHKNIDEYSYTVYGVYPYTKLSCAKQIQKEVRGKSSIYQKSLAVAHNKEIMGCIKNYYRRIYERLELSNMPKDIAKLYGAFYVHTNNIVKAKKYLELSKGDVKEFMRLTILYYVRLNKKKYLVGWINRVFK